MGREVTAVREELHLREQTILSIKEQLHSLRVCQHQPQPSITINSPPQPEPQPSTSTLTADHHNNLQYQGSHTVKFADDESAYRQEVDDVVDWCRGNNLCISVDKTKEIVVDFRRGRHTPSPLIIVGAEVEMVSLLKYLGIHISSDLKCVVESTLTFSITVWYGNSSAADKAALQRVVKASRCRSWASNIMRDPSHPAHNLFNPLPSGKRLRSLNARSTRLKHSFYPEAVMNVNLSEGDKVVFEDVGHMENTMLANESILMRGLVVRSHSNQISIRFHSRRSQGGSVLLRYQAFVLSCVFPLRPLYGDVSVSSLHSGGEAFFSCLSGYMLQGSSLLTCRNASTPYWSGKEPHCLAACGGLMRNVTVGRIVSPGFPSNYSNNLTCHWLLEAPQGHRLHIHFEKVALAEDDDRLLIKNGNSIDAAALYDSYEVEYLPNEGLLSTSRHLFIELTSDATGTSTGIAIRYQGFAAGHCYEPFVKYGNLTSSDNTWAVGAVVEFACDPGYTLEQGSVTIECMDPNYPQWNETEPACRAVCSGEITDSAGVVLSPNWPEAYDKGQDCIWGIHVEEDKRIMVDIQVLNIGKNDILTFYDGDDLTAKVLGQYGGSKSRFKLYTSTADVTIQFQSDPATNVYGYGNGFIVHFFEVARNDSCPELPEISNGWKSTSHPELVQGTVVTYQCYPGYQVVGAELLMCQWDLTWSGDLPSCERVVSCPDPGKVDHSRRVLSGPHFTVASTIQYICNKGFILSGNSLLTCFNRGSSGPKWNQKLPKCLPETFEPCSHPGTPTYGIPSSNKLHFQAGENLYYSCLIGHQLLGEPVLHCVPGHPSHWSGLPPVCKAHPAASDQHRLDVSTAYLRMEGAQVAFAVFIPIILLLVLVMGIYLYFSKVQRKPPHLSLSSNLPYENITGECTFDNSYETTETREYEVSI
ncbi:seizure protein 6 homolog [Perca flavescens]|uniref:seizure protein 6 homolog n=1 Tax=Perca flavescens TaxID=8167 RepID=UPI00106E4AD0|nr:seizure protein 6 homolog [Perca flavescens]